MTATIKITVNELLELCNYPIASIRQIAWKNKFESSTADKQNLWGGQTPVFSICFEDESNSCLFVAATDTSLIFRISHVDDYDCVAELSKQVGEHNDHDSEDLLGAFDLDSVICPVPDWENLSITRASVITTGSDDTIVGLCFFVNLGIRIGMFVAPNPGITLSFNDACDSVLSQADEAQKDGLVRVTTRVFANRKTPKQVDTIDWFDWLRK